MRFTRLLPLPQLEVYGARHPVLAAARHKHPGRSLVKFVVTIGMNKPWIATFIKHYRTTPGRPGM
ncbi:hypothetical protein AB3F22_04125 [Actinomyces johnsonii]|jgi:hypothetical protein|uniref:hypothetical protein n=1 Tax=Actinomyces johnsonii TaxID=544581 RepID=UPI001E2B0BA3|nr:hypothetical protein [Actinomyces johnsonii]